MDEEYALGARVALNSVKTHGSTYDRVVLINKDCSPQYVRAFLDDGLLVKVLEQDVNFNYEHKKRWGHVLNKLAVWNMLEYERVVFFDADVVAYTNPDVLMKCGHFCVVYMNQVHFHTGVMVIKPDRAMYASVIDGLTKLLSFDGADQGFLNSFFEQEARNAKKFDPSRGQSEDAVNRMTIVHNMNHLYFYPTLSWAPYVDKDSDILTLTYPTLFSQKVKPWSWYTYPFMDVNYVWLQERRALESIWEYWMYFAAVLVCPLWFWLSNLGVQKCSQLFPPVTGAVPFVPRLVKCMLVLVLLMSFYLPLRFGLPILIPYEFAWPFLLSYALLFSRVSVQLMCIACRWPLLVFQMRYLVDFLTPVAILALVSAVPAWGWRHGAFKAVAMVNILQ